MAWVVCKPQNIENQTSFECRETRMCSISAGSRRHELAPKNPPFQRHAPLFQFLLKSVKLLALNKGAVANPMFNVEYNYLTEIKLMATQGGYLQRKFHFWNARKHQSGSYKYSTETSK